MDKAANVATGRRFAFDSNNSKVGAFFETILPSTPTSNLRYFDPRVIYDQEARRFLVLCLEADQIAQTSRILIAASQTDSPAGLWWFREINSRFDYPNGSHTWADYVHLAADEKAVYLVGTMHQFSATPPYPFQGTMTWIINKQQLYSGAVPQINGPLDPFANVSAGIDRRTLAPAHVFGNLGQAVGTFLVGAGWEQQNQDALAIFRINNPLGTPTFDLTWALFGQISSGPTVGSRFQAQQPNNQPLIEAGQPQCYNAVLRNGALYTATIIRPSAAGADQGEPTVHWFQIPTSNITGGTIDLNAQSGNQHGNIGGESLAAQTATYYPWIAVNDRNDVAVSFSASGPCLNPGAYYTARRATDTPGTMQTPGTLAAGVSTYLRYSTTDPDHRNRWGDYCAMIVDGLNGTTFFSYNQFAHTPGHTLSGTVGDGRWGSAIGSLTFLTPGSLDPDVTSPITSSLGFVKSMFVQADGKIVVGGGFTSPRTYLLRLNADGTLDGTFNTPTGIQEVTQVIDGGGGTILVAHSQTANDPPPTSITRLTSNGSVDPTFTVATLNDLVNVLKRSASGQIYAGGFFTTVNGNSSPHFVRLTAAGAIDPAYPASVVNGPVNDMLINGADGTYLVGSFTTVHGQPSRGIGKINTISGAAVSTFNPGTGALGEVTSISLYLNDQGAGGVLIGGWFSSYNGISRPKLARITLNGALDTAYNFGAGPNSVVRSIAKQRNGKVIVAGSFTSFNGTPANSVVRLTQTGSIDSTWSPGSGPAGANPTVATAQFDLIERVLLGGYFTAYNGVSRVNVARVFGD
jgi:uncharacterized delta-60 repeat protein